MADESFAELIERALAEADEPLSIDEIGKRVFRRFGPKERNVVRVTLHRLDARGVLIKHPQKYEIDHSRE